MTNGEPDSAVVTTSAGQPPRWRLRPATWWGCTPRIPPRWCCRPGPAAPQAHRHVCCTNYHVIEGSGYSLVGGRQLDWEDKDVFTVPTWTFHEHVNTGNRPAFLFSFTDTPVMKALDLYREEAKG